MITQKKSCFSKIKLIIFLIILTGLLSSCGTSFDRSGYIQGMLDSTYKGDCDAYAAAINVSPQTLMNDHEIFIEREAQVWLQFCGINSEKDIPEDLKTSIIQLVDDLYTLTNYQVTDADHQGNVILTIMPLNIYNDVYKDFLEFNSQFKERNNNYEFTDYTDDDFMRAYLQPLIDMFLTHMQEPAYGEPVALSVEVNPNESGHYTINDEDVATIYNTIVNYIIADALQ